MARSPAALAQASAQRLGIGVFALAVVGVVLGLDAGMIATVIACGVVAGTAPGAAFTGTMRGLLGRTRPAERAGRMSTVYLFSYGGAAVPSLVAGRFAAIGLPLQAIPSGHAGLALVAAVTVLVLAVLHGRHSAWP